MNEYQYFIEPVNYILGEETLLLNVHSVKRSGYILIKDI